MAIAPAKAIRESMQEHANVTNDMLVILSNFENRLSSLETKILSVHTKTQKINVSQKNIDLALVEMQKINANFRAMEDEAELIHAGLQSTTNLKQ